MASGFRESVFWKYGSLGPQSLQGLMQLGDLQKQSTGTTLRDPRVRAQFRVLGGSGGLSK